MQSNGRTKWEPRPSENVLERRYKLKLRRLVSDLESAYAEWDQLGAQDPESWPAICHSYIKAKTRLYDALSLGTPTFDRETLEYAEQVV